MISIKMMAGSAQGSHLKKCIIQQVIDEADRHLDVLEDQMKAQFIIRTAGQDSNGVHIREVPLYIAGQTKSQQRHR